MAQTISILTDKLKKLEASQNEQSERQMDAENANADSLLLMRASSSSDNWTVSRIQNELRQRESELKSLKQRMANVQSTNDSYSDRIVELKSQNESLNKY